MARACRAGNIYVNRKITGARVGIEPFGGMQLSGTGPKTGGEEYVLAFLTRRKGYRFAPIVERQVQDSSTSVFPEGVKPWDSTPVANRQSILPSPAELLPKKPLHPY
jgi:delta 1-pyrroline-5-carboxylate dehydrogenase